MVEKCEKDTIRRLDMLNKEQIEGKGLDIDWDRISVYIMATIFMGMMTLVAYKLGYTMEDLRMIIKVVTK